MGCNCGVGWNFGFEKVCVASLDNLKVGNDPKTDLPTNFAPEQKFQKKKFIFKESNIK